MLLYALILLASAAYLWRHRQGPFLTVAAPLPSGLRQTLSTLAILLTLTAIAGIVAAFLTSTTPALVVLAVGALLMGYLGIRITRF
ncbi:hypothetical protein FC34_GL000630 [Lacticaseibacillus brantae DSM 23927]|uniref:Uncharacterized protein n=2 Tax=Lacticaseibacillus brantae TaxID=943673 RepID=A0A0R2B9S2_9LACO|nr:hypothetical protein FC34_GL000630 [Lacticaseibacillus brantae DSM 23927]